MGQILIQILFTFLTSEAAKTFIAIGVNKLLKHKKDGITSDVAKTMIDGIAKSKLNPTTEDLFTDALELLKPKEETTKEP